jgi:hypothetical protein
LLSVPTRRAGEEDCAIANQKLKIEGGEEPAVDASSQFAIFNFQFVICNPVPLSP